MCSRTDGTTLSVAASEWTLDRLLKQAGLPSPPSPIALDLPVTSITDDSRHVQPGSLFAAVRGGACDGHEFIESAVRAGATCVLTDRPATLPPGIAEIRVPDTRTALARLAAAYHRLRPGQRIEPIRLIGVTGTNGKSTVCEILNSILVAAGQNTALLGTIRYALPDQTLSSTLTTPPPTELCAHLARAADAGARWAVMEVSSHALDQRRCDGLDFAAGVFTNLSGDHLDYHGDRHSYLAAKKRLFDQLDAGSTAVVNADDGVTPALLADCRANVVRYGLDNRGADVTARIESLTADGSAYDIDCHGHLLPISSRLIGRHNVLNALAAAAAARSLGLDDTAIRQGIENLPGVRGRLEEVRVTGQTFAVFVDYAHTDDALRHVLAALKPLTGGRLICVFGCGGDRDRSKRPRMAAAVAEAAHLAVVTSDNPRTEDPARIFADILPGFEPATRCRVEVQPDRRTAIELAVAQAQPEDIVLIAGKGHEDYQIIGRTRRHFDDVEEARSCLAARFTTGGKRL